MTSPEVNVGSIIARVALDTSGLKKGEADATTSLKRTTAGLEKTAQSADKVQKKVDAATTSIKRNADVQVDAIRRTSQEERRARSTAGSSGGGGVLAGGRGTRGGAVSGAAAGAIVGQFGIQAIEATADRLGNGSGGNRDRAAGALQGAASGALFGAAVGSIVPGVGTAVGAVAGGAVGGAVGVDKTQMDNLEKAAIRESKPLYMAKIRKLRDSGAIDQARARQIIASAPKEYQADLTKLLAVQLVGPLPNLTPLSGVQRGVAVSQGQVGVAQSNLGSLRRVAVSGQFDDAPDLTSGDPEKAAAKVTAASGRVQDAQDRVAAATRRLDELRKRATTSTTQLATAEDNLARAQRRLHDAQGGLSTAKDAATKAGAPTALSASDVLKRSAGQLKNEQSLAAAAKTLYAKGVSGPVLQNLEELEKTAPGTMARVAKGLTAGAVHQLNADQGHLQRAYESFLQQPLAAAVRTAEAEAARAAAAYSTSLAEAFGQIRADQGLPLPVGNRTPTPRTSRSGTPVSQVTNYNFKDAKIVASNPADLARELQARARITQIGGVT